MAEVLIWCRILKEILKKKQEGPDGDEKESTHCHKRKEWLHFTLAPVKQIVKIKNVIAILEV